MNRPYIICHMTMSLDGKVTGDFLRRAEHSGVSEIYYRINRDYGADAYACGRVTMEESFTGGWYPDLSEYHPVQHSAEHKTDFISDEKCITGFYSIAFDPHGRLGWKSNRIIDIDEDPGYDNAQIIEVLTENVDSRYLGYLQKMDIPYIFAGKNEIDIEVALLKLKKFFNVKTLLLEGGSIINGAFLRADVVDELSLVMDPVIASADSKSLFTDAIIKSYRLENIKNYNGILHLTYKANR